MNNPSSHSTPPARKNHPDHPKKMRINLRKTSQCHKIADMTTNPYAYYDDEPLPIKSRPLSVSSDGEEEPDMEPRVPLELKGYFIRFYLPAVKTYRINIERDTFESRLPNGEFLQLSREEAREQVSVHGREIEIVVPGDRRYCFQCKPREKDVLLALARLKVWLQPPIRDPEDAYNAIAEQLKKGWSQLFIGFSAAFLMLFIFTTWEDYPFWKFNRPGVLLYPALLNLGVCLIRSVCVLLFALFLVSRLFGKANLHLFRAGVLISLVLSIYVLITLFVPTLQVDNLHPCFNLFEFHLPLVLCVIYHRYRRSEKQLQRDNGLI
jgi:hypothetical protein